MVHVFDGPFHAIFRPFLRARERFVTAGDDALHHLGIGAERRRTLGRIEDAESSGRPGADVEETAAASKGGLRFSDRPGDGVALTGDCIGNGSVFSVYEIYNLRRRREVDLG